MASAKKRLAKNADKESAIEDAGQGVSFQQE
jgi:hypothetical protein